MHSRVASRDLSRNLSFDDGSSSFHAPSPSFDIIALEEILKSLACQRMLPKGLEAEDHEAASSRHSDHPLEASPAH